ncbi:putative HxlR family transcriptional regulator [Gordonia effusa NBRC 100432]|uniref:Putative HxlR family transcriptional regulator n=1 Tax=Gordonia effusa NBRC 100432 TaxID=1077974 RepID=H0QXT5_9ACTN|nr:helix-turn-helix domain-containing protein [Gordonia effusa]GAB17636.1 putative HxlR family transcriptional regulator [Gordonia effusa NBRC 100432]
MPTMTAAQKKAAEKSSYDAFMAGCKSRQLLERIADKWVALVLCSIDEAGEPQRFSELSRSIAGVSQKMLTQTLRNLERDGLVTRTVTPTVPVTVHYALTPLGASLRILCGQLKTWAQAHMDEILAARDSYDNRSD